MSTGSLSCNNNVGSESHDGERALPHLTQSLLSPGLPRFPRKSLRASVSRVVGVPVNSVANSEGEKVRRIGTNDEKAKTMVPPV